MRIVIMMTALCAMASAAHAAPRYKDLPSEKDMQQMEETLAPGQSVDLQTFLTNPAAHHWTSFYQAAQQLFDTDRKDEAVKWFYIGQLRGRVASALDPDPSRNGALLEALNAGIGQRINKYAGEDIDNWIEQIDAAMAWDKEHPLPANPRAVIGIDEVAFDTANFIVVYGAIRDGLHEMRASLAAKN